MKIIYDSNSKEHVTDEDIEFYSNKYRDRVNLDNLKYSKQAGESISPITFIGLHFDIQDEYLVCKPILHMKKFSRIRRITGYLVGDLDRFNNAKYSEQEDRVKHRRED